MLVVSNTKELEMYGLEKVKDDEEVRILGGLAGKEKYNEERYIKRTTYKGSTIKKIIQQMNLIESKIPKEWNDWQKAKYIYETLREKISYNMDRSTYSNQQSSNLNCLLSKKGICVGYALLFKEMMDRQGIECDYIRGIGGRSKHAWNVLTIDGTSFQVDLTWDSIMFRRGEKKSEYFGVDKSFDEEHIQDLDETEYGISILPQNFVDSIDTNINQQKGEKNEEELDSIISEAIEQTYKKYKKDGNTAARLQAEDAVRQYIVNNDPYYFTRTGNARSNIVKNVSQEKMMDFLMKRYIENCINSDNKSILENSIYDTYSKYGIEHVIGALKRYIKEERITGFTRDNNARDNIEKLFTPDMVLEEAIKDVVNEEITRIEESTQNVYFSTDEFKDMELSQPKESMNLISKVMKWIKMKMNNKTKNKVVDNRLNQKDMDKEENR